ncbi:MAG: hypothetical protein BWX99_01808 [Deltaproteobacteria bacterium ADurb.Bin151]|jgi:hypothetical protein|nr:hypothetical protein [Smithella sp.]OQB54785.1 MAG: hypothetical protein BWX99_01808 [Deltaproteobacteria bacterium ADurb.Bin151]HPL65705.1 hypothetical protein [Smithellaceae bacterium]HQP25056.1 hypothetical protein [Smithellaceae bacterium]
MSIEMWRDPNTGTRYPVGYESVEHAITKDTALAFAADIFRALYPGLPIISALAVGLLDWNGYSVIPTYGSWAGPGCPTGARLDIFLVASDAGLSHSQVKYAIEEADALVNCKIPGMKETLSS